MQNFICPLILLWAGLTGPFLNAQTFTYVVSGMVVPCVPGDSVQLHLWFYDQPSIDTVVTVDPGSCMFTTTFLLTEDYPHLTASIPCNNSLVYAIDSAIFSFPDHVLAYDTLILDCGGVPHDCAGVPYGPNLPGSPCDDGNPTTSNDLWQPDCSCAGDIAGNIYDCLGIAYGPNMPGTPCDDVDSLTTNDTWALDCTCNGGPFEFDCFGMQNGPAMPGTPCDDGDPLTIGDAWSVACNCAGYAPSPCWIHFQVHQSLAYDTLTATTTPIPNALWAGVQSNGAWPFQYLWDFGDGSSSTDPYPTHIYAGNGPYILCGTITDAIGCSSTTCDTVSVDADGMIEGMTLHDGGHSVALHQRSGFTIMILNELSTSVAEVSGNGSFQLWPNPATDQLNLRMRTTGSVLASVRITDMNGRVSVEREARFTPGSNTITLPITNLSPGIYIVQIEDASGIWSSRFVKAE